MTRRYARDARCEQPGCGEPHHAGGLCGMHAVRKRRGMDMDAPARPYRPGGECQEADCLRPQHAMGRCKAHHQQLRRKGAVVQLRIQGVMPGDGPRCSEDGCPNPAAATGLCGKHYTRLHRTGDVNGLRPRTGPGRPGTDPLKSEKERLLAGQGGLCAICRTREPRCADFDPAFHSLRGMLCSQCNTAIGLLRDDPDLMVAAAVYVTAARLQIKEVV